MEPKDMTNENYPFWATSPFQTSLNQTPRSAGVETKLCEDNILLATSPNIKSNPA